MKSIAAVMTGGGFEEFGTHPKCLRILYKRRDGGIVVGGVKVRRQANS